MKPAEMCETRSQPASPMAAARAVTIRNGPARSWGPRGPACSWCRLGDAVRPDERLLDEGIELGGGDAQLAQQGRGIFFFVAIRREEQGGQAQVGAQGAFAPQQGIAHWDVDTD